LADVGARLHRHTVLGYRFDLEQFAQGVNIKYLDEVNRQALLQYICGLKRDKYSPRSMYNKVINVGSFLNFHEMPCPLRKFDRPRFEEKQVTACAEQELQKFRDAAGATSEELDVLETLVATGFRKAELANLRWADIGFPTN
jgi:site-specific recombinase XerD